MAGPVIQGIDTLASAMKGNIIPDQEYLLQGSLLDSHIEVFKHRLRGLCDNTLGGEEQFCEREMVFSIRGTSPQPLSLRVRKTENLGAPPHMQRDNDTPWQLRYLGQGETGQRATSVRSCYDITCSENAVEFLTELGCRLEFEYIAKGFVFRKGRMKITVSKVHKIGQGPPPPNGGPPQEALEPLTGSHLVELSVLAPSGSDAVADDMKNFSEQLKPLVTMDKIDPRRQM